MKKRIIFICLLSILTTAVNAQTLGAKAGFSIANGIYKLSGTKMPTTYLVGIPVGIVGEIPVSEIVFLNSGLLLIKKGTKRDITDAEVKIPVRYLEIPVNVAFKHDFGNWKLFGQAGPYTGVGISAKIKRGDDKDKVEFGSGTDEFKRMDFGLNLGGGVEIDKIQIVLNYGFGFINISQAQAETIRNRVFTVSSVYNLNDLLSNLRY